MIVSVQGIGTMANSRLRSCFHSDVFGRNLGRCVKWGSVIVGLKQKQNIECMSEMCSM